MKVAVVMLVSVVALTACKTKEEERVIVNSLLPDDCEMIELGSFGEIDELVVIRCGDQTTTNIAEIQPVGKTVVTNGAAVHAGQQP